MLNHAKLIEVFPLSRIAVWYATTLWTPPALGIVTIGPMLPALTWGGTPPTIVIPVPPIGISLVWRIQIRRRLLLIMLYYFGLEGFGRIREIPPAQYTCGNMTKRERNLLH